MCQAFLTSNSQKSYFILNQEVNLKGFDRHFKLITYEQADFIYFRQTDRRTDISDSRVAIATVNIIIQAKPRDPKPSRSTIILDVDLTRSFTD